MHQHKHRPLAAAALLLALAWPAAANDSEAELAAGGLVLVKNDNIVMQREDLTLSPTEVRVRYEMRNVTDRPLMLRVAFPMPEVPSEGPAGLSTSTGGYNIAMRPPTDPNFMQFRVWADQREIAPEVEVKALLPDGRDVAAALREIGGMKLVLRPGLFFLTDDDAPDAAMRARLEVLGALEKLDASAIRLPWIPRVTFHWMQTFAPGVTVVEHVYRPIVGSRFVMRDDKGRLTGSGGGDTVRDLCIDAPTDQAIRALEKRVRDKSDVGMLIGHTLGYVLQTARNWSGPIGTFHLTLEGGPMRPEDAGKSEVRITSLCTDLPLRRTGPQRFEATVSDYVPKDDLRILYIAE